MSVHTVLLTAIAATVSLCGLGAHGEYTAAAAVSALQFAKASYCDASNITSWTCSSCSAQPSFSAPQVFQDSDTGTQGYIGVDSTRIVVAFRGSQNFQNWISNIQFAQVKYPNTNCSDCNVHTGFFNSYLGLMTQVLQGVQDLLKAHPTHSVLVTGHSLGGAIATFAAADIAQLQGQSGTAPHIDLYTFGSPRVGNQAFANWMAKLFCSGGHASYRVTHKRDMVPHLPGMISKFVHVSREYWYNNDNETDWANCNNEQGDNCADKTVSEDSSCSNSISPVSTADHLLYLGICTSCSCDAAWRDARVNAEASAQLKLIVAADYAAQHPESKEVLHMIRELF